MKRSRFLKDGFTLIEVLIVIGIIAILAAIVVIAINPAKQFAQARNAQRESNINTILNALGQNLVDNKGVFVCSTATTQPSGSPTNIGTNSGLVDLSCLVPTYIPGTLPFDPDGGTPGDSLYSIVLDTNGRFTVCAPKHAEASIPSSTSYCLTR